jgi:mannose/cellobiose epimerase-like protein (N-acyl-D-glucosamine 2-epimerase family)
MQALLGEPMVRFHDALADRARRDQNFHFHYVTARELANLALAAELGWTGSIADGVDHSIQFAAT